MSHVSQSQRQGYNQLKNDDSKNKYINVGRNNRIYNKFLEEVLTSNKLIIIKCLVMLFKITLI